MVVAEDAKEDAEDEALNKLGGNLSPGYFLVAAARARPTELVALMLKRLNKTLRREVWGKRAARRKTVPARKKGCKEKKRLQREPEKEMVGVLHDFWHC